LDRVLRGGSWFDDADDARSAYRFNYAPDYRDDYYGFRAVLSPGQP
jgi:formylglycine-generating enzyme required for sulfatase activity